MTCAQRPSDHHTDDQLASGLGQRLVLGTIQKSLHLDKGHRFQPHSMMLIHCGMCKYGFCAKWTFENTVKKFNVGLIRQEHIFNMHMGDLKNVFTTFSKVFFSRKRFHLPPCPIAQTYKKHNTQDCCCMLFMPVLVKNSCISSCYCRSLGNLTGQAFVFFYRIFLNFGVKCHSLAHSFFHSVMTGFSIFHSICNALETLESYQNWPFKKDIPMMP